MSTLYADSPPASVSAVQKLDNKQVLDFYNRAIEKAENAIVRKKTTEEHRDLGVAKNVIYSAARTLAIISAEGNLPNANFTDKQLFALGIFFRKLNAVFQSDFNSAQRSAVDTFFKKCYGHKRYGKSTDFVIEKREDTRAIDSFCRKVFDDYKVFYTVNTESNGNTEYIANDSAFNFIYLTIAERSIFSIENHYRHRGVFALETMMLSKGKYSIETFLEKALPRYTNSVKEVVEYFLKGDFSLEDLNPMEFEMYANIAGAEVKNPMASTVYGYAELARFSTIYNFL